VKDTEILRFWSYVDVRGPVPTGRPELGPCWLWRGGRSPRGYGHFWIQRRRFRASRISLGLSIGRELAPEEYALHECDNPPCVRPTHLHVGDQSLNQLEAHARGRYPAMRIVCRRGHRVAGDNAASRYGGRIGARCRTCDNTTKRARYRQDRVPTSLVEPATRCAGSTKDAGPAPSPGAGAGLQLLGF